MNCLYVRVSICLLILFNVSLSTVNSQSNPNEDEGGNWKLWGGVDVDLTLSRKAEFSVNYLRGYNLGKPSSISFNQVGASYDYDFSKKFGVKTGIVVNQFPGSDNLTYRGYLRGTYKGKLGKKLNWANGIQLEKHSRNENRFDYRVIYMTRLSLRKRFDFLNISPSVSYALYYNIGGSKIQYYDQEGLRTVKQSADGFHRGRLTFNVNSKISDMLSVSAYYLLQNEFNLFAGNREINVTKPNGKITRPFNDYSVLGLSLLFNFDMYL